MEADDEIEVTPEMLKAGINEAMDWQVQCESDVEEWLPDVFRVMFAVWLKQRREAGLPLE